MHDIYALNQENWSVRGRDIQITANVVPMSVRVKKGLIICHNSVHMAGGEWEDSPIHFWTDGDISVHFGRGYHR